jgi:nucleoside-triphosphatase THEP1
MPIYTRCIKPQSIDPKLFTDREGEYYHLKEILKSIILTKEEEERRLLIHGERGIGKSILLRKVLSHLKQEIDFIPVIVDGRYSLDAEELLRDICEKLASLLRDDEDYKNDDKAISEISYLDEVSRADKITKGGAKNRASEIEAKSGAGIGFLNFFKLSFGFGGRETESEELTKSIITEINSRFLRELLSFVIKTIKKEVVIAIDNLDQIQDKNQIAEFVREIFKHRESLIIATLRSEAITAEFRRSFRDPILIKGLLPEALMDILLRRIEKCPEREILKKKLPSIADTLKTLTDNPLSFLTWIHYLCNNSELTPKNLLNDLNGFVLTHYNFDLEKASSISTFFLEKENPFLPKETILAQSKISDDDCAVMIENGILVPDDLYEPRKYRLSPDLVFFKLK